MASSWSCGERPSGAVTVTFAASWRRSPATRNHVELVEVRTEDRRELQALEQRIPRIERFAGAPSN